MAQNLQNHHVSICTKRKFLSISTRKKVMIEKLFNKFVCLYLTNSFFAGILLSNCVNQSFGQTAK